MTIQIESYDFRNDWPGISIVMSPLNQAQHIEEAIRSVVFQNYPNLQFVIIDRGSVDGTMEIIKKYSEYLDYWISEPDLGESDALNKGLSRCTGEIVNWLNSDDYYEKNAFRVIAEHFLQNDIDVLVMNEYRLDHDGAKSVTSGSAIKRELEKTVLFGQIAQPSTFWKLDVFRSLGMLDTDLTYAMDVDLWLRYLLKYGQERIKQVSDAIVNFRSHQSSKMATSLPMIFKERLSLAHSVLSFLEAPVHFLSSLSEQIDKVRTKEWIIQSSLDREKFIYYGMIYLVDYYIHRGQYSKIKEIFRL